jgi:peptidoglycan/LPS O-acetylase OafA/YrhL
VVATVPRTDDATGPCSEPTGHDTGFRPDVQGLRAIAVLMVVIYHLNPSLLPGGFAGVDVFFAISGFLITGHLLRGYERTGRVHLLDFWGRRARRLLPAAALVLAVTWLVSLVALPLSRLPDTAGQVRASALYFQNWVLAHDAVDYLKADSAPSPVQHFWSLSVEEQFYLGWPLLFVLAGLLAVRLSHGVGHGAGRPVMFGFALAATLASLAYSAYYTHANPAGAYFVTTTRVWELGLGGALALLASRASRVLAWQGWLGWLGLGMVVASAFVLSDQSAFPGTVALLPVGGAVLLIAGGSAKARRGPGRLTSLRGMVFLGDISYSMYLWHWPIIVLWTGYTARSIGLLDGAAILAASIGLAWLTKVLVEDRVRLAAFIARYRGRSLATALVAIVPVTLVTVYLASQPSPFDGQLGPEYPGAAVLAGDVRTVPEAPTVPRLVDVGSDLPAYEKQGCEAGQHVSTPKTCTFGDTTHPRRTIALVGDSIAGEWFPALNEIAQQQHWRLVTALHSTCPWTAAVAIDPVTNGPYTSCHTWGGKLINELLTKVKPDAVITTARPGLATPDDRSGGAESVAEIGAGMARYWRTLIAHGISVIPIQESPEMYQDEPDCLSGRLAHRTCGVAASKAIAPNPPTVVATQAMKGAVDLIDMNPFICGPTECQGIVGNVVVYRDSHHLTNTYARTLAPYLQKYLLENRALRRL